jgi:glycosidase
MTYTKKLFLSHSKLLYKIAYLAALIFLLTPLFFSFLSTKSSAIIEKPQIDKIDPPNWWLNHTINPVQVLIYGRNFSNSKLSLNQAGVKVVNSTVSTNGTYIIAYLDIDSEKATPGNLKINVENSGGSASIDFGLAPLPETKGKYQGFNPDDVIYLIMVDRFADGDQSNNNPSESAGFYDRNKPRGYHGGDIQGIINNLPYLKELGVTTIWMTPIYDNSNRASDYHGYGCVDYYKVEEHFGTLEKFRELVDEAHKQGIKIMQDQVLNHTGPDHPWTDNQPTPNFINGTRQQHLNNVFDIPSLTVPNGDPFRADLTLRGWFADILPDLNQNNKETEQYLIQNSLWWIASTGLDAVRLDTFPYIPRSFWSNWNSAIHKQYPTFTVVGEVLDGRPGVVSFFQGGVKRFDNIDSGLDTVFDYPNCYAIRDYFARNKNSLSSIVEADPGYPKADVLVPFFGNHDIKRFASEPGATTESAILAYTYLLTMRGTPQIYYGDEIGISGGEDPDNRKDFPGGFPGDKRSAFIASGRTKTESKLFDSIKKVSQLRQKTPQLRGGEMKFLYEDQNLAVYLRSKDGKYAIVALNNSNNTLKQKLTVPTDLFPDGTRFTNKLDERYSTSVTKSKLKLKLAPKEAAILLPN